ncbi:uncharacterized protein LOC113783347 [Coffea eugenioides]|uniref:uncharacterized protein LOC113783347 n=1 Tax=Coffea eugenioides TaxID=49369 RepID=UPI000F5D1F18|nr:uncharacterized protein LOC113710306 [Coffea arabica]XP_027089037.1 uncharacterized protein LOC113710306 [Coffea arabica]XP_027185257.1 uncharacterized protein LOC113783347 [Coffea eugenioides]XP_027185258.1 uncharacterized protein LOC113783347 [Coffea eugenioides]XP_027185259.1 uncharacterized protein LOC113783347 [Coffea eugenioides]
MERNVGKGMMGLPKNYEQVRYSSVETRAEGIGSANQRFFQDPASSINTNIRPPEFGIPVVARPVLNYSIQTGEEFALEFMRDRVNPRQQFIPNASGAEHSGASSYTDLKGILGITSTGSESGSEVSMIPSAGKSQVQVHQRNNSMATEEKDFYQPVQTVIRSSSGNNISHGVHNRGQPRSVDTSAAKLKFLCSFGGKIMPRPSDGKLRYVGGETRIVRVNRDVSWEELLQKTMAIYNQTRVIKYQLPGEDLDALVSVSCNEDLRNMIDECNVLEEGGTQKPRMFLFSPSDLDDSQLSLGSMEGDSEFQYVVAVNGMDFGSRRNSIGLASTSGNNLDELLGFSVERESSRVAADLTGSNTAQPMDEMYVSSQSSQTMGQSLSHAFESNPHSYHGNKVLGEVEMRLLPNFQQRESLPKTDGQSFVQSSATLQYTYNSHGSHQPVNVENLVPHSSQGHIVRQGGLTQEQPYVSLLIHKPEPLATEMKINRDNSIKKKSESYTDQSVDNDVLVKETKMRRENSTQRITEPEKMQPSGGKNIVSSTQHDFYASDLASKDEASVARSAEHPGPAAVHLKTSEKDQEPLQNSVTPEAFEEEKADKFNEEGHLYLSGKASADGCGDLDTHPTDASHEPQVLAQRIFRSERIPREQAGLNRLSKSDDSSGAQFLITHTQSDVAQHFTESVDRLHERNADGTESSDKMQERNVASQTEKFLPSGKPQHHHLPATGNKREVTEKSIEADSKATFPNSGISQEASGSNLQKSEQKAPVIPEKEISGSSCLAASQGISEKVHDESTAKLMELPLGEIAAIRMDPSTKKVQILPTVGKEHPVAASPEEKPSTSVSVQEQGDILIDINDRFHPHFLSDMFSKAKIDGTRVAPLPSDGNGLSLNMENHEPKRWSFFQKLAQDDFVRRDVSLIDQDHVGFSPRTNVEDVVSVDYSFAPSRDVGVAVGHIDSQINFGSDVQQQSRGFVEPNTMNVPTDYNPSQTTSLQSMQFDGPMNSRIPESDYQDEKIEAQHAGFPLIDLSLVDFDPSSLQIIMNEDLEELRELGSGTFGTVYHGKWRGTDVAIKRIKKSCFTGRSSEQERLTVEFWREAEILSKLHHPNVVAFYGVVQDGPGGTLATVTEFMVNGSLRHVLLSKDRHLDRRKRLTIAMDAAFGMEYLHSKNIVHFDLKCDNLLVNLKDPSRPICKVGDFGLSKIKRNTLVTGGVRGTLPWMAPELLNGSSSKVSEKVDVFSFGIVLWEILTGEEPYANMHYGAIIGGIVNNTLRPPVPSYCDPDWRLLMEQCWAPDPAARPSFTEIARRLRLMSTAGPTRTQGYTKQNQLSK